MAPTSKTILVIDDTPELLDLSRRTLEKDGFTVVTMTDSEDALAWVHAQKDPPVLILLDAILPGMDGWGFLRALARGPRASIPTILASGMVDLENSKLPAGVNVVDRLDKPFTGETLSKAVSRALAAERFR